MVNKHKTGMTLLMVTALIVSLTIIVAMCVSAFTNKSLFDTTYSFERAIVELPNGQIVEGKVSNWTDFEDGDQIQLRIGDKTYLTHISNVVLISE